MRDRLFTCNICMLIKGYLSNYNGVIKATLLHSESVPYISGCQGERRESSSPGIPASRSSPLNSNPRALYQHLIPVSICLKMAANAGSMFQYWKRFDLQQLQVSSPSVPFPPSPARFRRVSPVGGEVFVFFGGRLVGVWEENSRPLPHIDESGSLADQKLILFVQFGIDRTPQLGKPGRRRGDAPA